MKVTYIDHMGTDLSVVNAARVSFGKTSEFLVGPQGTKELKEKDRKLIKYLATHGHHSPFNHTYITLHVKAPIFVARQLVKHKFMPWNEISRRYVDDEPEFYWPEVWRGKSKDKRQGSSGEVSLKTSQTVQNCYGVEQALCSYQDLLDSGAAPEQARMVLPQNTYTEWYWSGTLGAWCDMYNLRSKPDVQLETQEIASQAGEILKGLYPVSFKELTG